MTRKSKSRNKNELKQDKNVDNNEVVSMGRNELNKEMVDDFFDEQIVKKFIAEHRYDEAVDYLLQALLLVGDSDLSQKILRYLIDIGTKQELKDHNVVLLAVYFLEKKGWIDAEMLGVLKEYYEKRRMQNRLKNLWINYAIALKDAKEFLLLADKVSKVNKLEALGYYILCGQKFKNIIALERAESLAVELSLFETLFRILSFEEELFDDKQLYSNKIKDFLARTVELPLYLNLNKQALEKLMVYKPDSRSVKNFQNILAEIENNPQSALSNLRALAVEQKDRAASARIYLNIAYLLMNYFGESHTNEIEDALNKAISLNPVSYCGQKLVYEYCLRFKKINFSEFVSRELSNLKVVSSKIDFLLISTLLMNTSVQDVEQIMDILNGVQGENPDNIFLNSFLGEMYIEKGDYKSAIQLFNRCLLVTRVDEQKARYLEILGKLYEYGDNYEDAYLNYLDAFKITGPEPRLIDSLINTAQKANLVKEVPEIFFYKSFFVEGKGEKIEILVKSIELYLSKGDIQNAIRSFNVLVRLEPTNRMVLHFIDEFLGRGVLPQNILDVLVPVVEDSFSKTEDKYLYLPLYKKIASIFHKNLNDIEKAVKFYKVVLSIDSEDIETVKILSSIAMTTQAIDDIESAIRKEIELSNRLADRIVALKKLAQIKEERRQDYISAISIYREILSSDPTDEFSRNKLKNLYRKVKKKDEFVSLMKEEIDSASHVNEKNRKRIELAEVLLTEMDSPEEAFSFIIDVYKSDESYEDVYRLLSLFADSGLLLDKITPIYKPYLIKKSDYQTYIRLVEIELKIETDVNKRVRALGELATIYESKLNHKDLAFNTRVRIFKEMPYDVDNIQILIKMAEDVRGEEELARIFVERGSMDDCPEDIRLVILRYAADTYEKKLNDINGLKTTLGILSRYVSNDIDILSRFISLAQETSDYVALAESLFRRAMLAEDKNGKIKDLMEAARIYEIELKDDVKAISALAQILELDPYNLQILKRLERLLEKTMMWENLVKVLKQELRIVTEPLDRSQIFMKIGDISLERLEKDDEAIEAYKEALKANIVSEIVLLKLMNLMNESPNYSDIFGFIEETFTNNGEWGLLSNFYTRVIPNLKDKGHKKEIYIKLSNVYKDRLNQMDLVYSTLCKALRELPEYEDIAQRLEEAALGLNLFEETVELFEEIAEDEKIDASIRAAIYVRAAKFSKAVLNNINRALEYAKKANGLVHDNAEYINLLGEYQREAGRYSDLVNLYEQKLRLAKSDLEKKNICFEMADVIEKKLEDVKGAADVLFELFKKDPSDKDVFEKIVDITTRGEQYGILARVLEKRIEFAESEGMQKELKLKLAEIKKDKLLDFDSATQIVESILTSDPECNKAVKILDEIFDKSPDKLRPGRLLYSILKQTNQKAAMVRVLEILAASVESPKERIDYLVEAADISLELGDKQRATEFYIKAFNIDYENIHLLKKLIDIADSYELWEQIAMVCEEALSQLLTEETMKYIKKQLADIRQRYLGDSNGAFELYKELVLEDMSEMDMVEILSALEAQYRERDDKEGLLQVLKRRLKYVEDIKDRTALLMEIAEIQIDFMNRVDTGFETLKQIVELAPENEFALRKISEIASSLGRWQDLMEALSKLLLIVKDDVELSEYKFELGLIYEERMNDIKSALEYYKESFKHNKENAVLLRHLRELFEKGKYIKEVVPLLADIYITNSNFDEAVAIYEKASKMNIEKNVRYEYMNKVAEIYMKDMQQPEMAFLSLVKLLREFPEQTEILSRLEDIAKEIGSFEEVVATLEEIYSSVRSKSVRTEYALRLGKIYEEEIKDQDQAMVYFEEVVAANPQNEIALASLDRIYRLKGEWEKLTSVIEEEIKISRDEDEKINLIFRLAKVLEEKLQDAKGAIVSYNRILELKPDHRLAIRSLEKLYESLKDFANLRKILEKELELAQEEDDKIRIKTRIASILGSKIGESEKSIEMFKEIFEEDSSNDEAFEALENYYQDKGDYKELAILYKKYIDAIVDKSKSIPFRIRLADVLIKKLMDYQEAKLVLNESLAIEPQNTRLLLLLREVYRLTGEFVDEATVLKRLIPLQEDPQRLKEFRLELMELLGDKLGRREEAIEVSKRVLDIEPHTIEELRRVSSVLRNLFAYEELISVLELMIDMVEEGERFDIYKEIASIYLENIGDERQALFNYEKAFEINSADSDVFEKLVNLLRSANKITKLPPYYEKKIQIEKDGSNRKALLISLAQLYESEMRDIEMAFLTWCRVLKEDYTDREVLSKVEELAEKTHLYEELYAVYGDAIDSITDSELLEYLKRRQAEISIAKLGEKEEAEKHYKEVIELNPHNLEPYHKLQDIYEKDGRYLDLIDIIDREIQVSHDIERKIELYIRIADIYHKNINNSDEASAILKKALVLDGSNKKLIQKMIDFYQETERFEDLVQSIKRMIDNLEPDEQIPYYLKLGNVYESKLKQDDRAVEAYLSILDIDAKNFDGLKALESIYQRLNMHEELVGIYESEIPILTEPSEIIDLHFKAGGVYEEILSDYSKAIEHYNAILDIDPTDLNAIKSLERCYLAEQNYEYLVDTYKRHLELTDDPDERIDILLKMATICRDELKRADLSEAYYSQVLKFDPNNREAIHNLAELYEKSGNWFNAVEMLRREADSLGQTSEAVQIYFRLGKIHEEMLLDLESAKESYRRAIDIDPAFIDAVRALRGIYGSEKNLNQYLELMKHEAQYISDPEEKKRIYFEMGKIYEEEKNDIEQAKFYYEEALKIDFGYVAVAKILADIYFREENWQRAESCLEVVVKDLERTGDRKEIARQYYRLGYIAEKLNDMQKAIRSYQAAYDMDPSYLPVMESLAIGYTQLEMWEKASAIYQNMIVKQKDVLSDAEIVDIYYQIGEIERRLGNLEKALSFLKKGYEIDDRHIKILTLLKEIYVERAEWDDVYDMYLQLISAISDQERFEMYMELGQICVDKLNDVFRAIDSYSGALRSAKSPEQKQQAMEKIYPLYIEARQPQKAVSILKELVQIEKDKNRQKQYFIKLAELSRKSLSNLDEALEYYNKVLDIDPNYTQAFAEIEKILADRRDWKGLEEAYRSMIQRTPKDQKARRLILWRSLADLYYRALRDTEAAIMAYEVVSGLDKDNAEILEILAELYSSKEKYRDKAIKTYHQLIKFTTNPVKVCKALKRLYLATKQYDRVYIICNVLKFLKSADAEDDRIISQLRTKLKDLAAKSITENLWENSILHEQAKGVISAIFSAVIKKYPEIFLVPPEAYGLKKSDYIDVNTSQLFAASMLRYVKGVLNIPALQVYKGQPGSSGIRLVATNPPSLILGEDMFKERSKKEIWLLMAKELTFVRPEFLILSSKPPEHLDAILNAILAIVQPSALMEGNPLLNQEYARLFAPKMTPDTMMVFKALASRFYNEKVRPRIEDFKEGVELSSIRAGVAITQDFEFALSMIQKIPFRVYKVPQRTLLREIVIYYMSEEYMDLRDKLGLSVSI
ncbi:MAG: tetratricopeptide repeat protein [Deltaproteobacteria bacterium]|nr:tetratricopeptide repeat protein [Deltaproteobacteria bacterium]